MSKTTFSLIVVLVICGALNVAPESCKGDVEAAPTSRPATQPQDPREVLDAIKSRLARLSNVIVEYETKVTYPPLPPGKKAIVKRKGYSIIVMTGSQQWHKKFMTLGKLSRYEEKITIIQGDARGPDWRPETESTVRTYGPKGSAYLGLDKNGKVARAVVYDPRPLPLPEIEIGLGLRAHGQTDRISTDAIDGMVLSLPSDDQAILRCKDNESFTHEWTFLRRHGYAMSRYHRKPPPGKAVHYEAIMRDFKDVDGMILPHSMTLTSKTIRPNQTKVHVATEASVIGYRVGDPSNTPDGYRIKWPVGTALRDRREQATRSATTKATREAAQTLPATTPTGR